MSQYTDLTAAIVGWTKKSNLSTEMDIAIKNAIRKAHNAGKFARDLVTVDLTGLTIQQIQAIDYTNAVNFERFRQLCTIGPTGVDFQYDIVNVLDLFDSDHYARDDIAYIVGTEINVRAASPTDALTLRYYRRPDLAVIADLNDWIVDQHFDLISLWATSSVLTVMNEKEIASRVDNLAALSYADLIADSVESQGR